MNCEHWRYYRVSWKLIYVSKWAKVAGYEKPFCHAGNLANSDYLELNFFFYYDLHGDGRRIHPVPSPGAVPSAEPNPPRSGGDTPATPG